jgi:hypothetical protein
MREKVQGHGGRVFPLATRTLEARLASLTGWCVRLVVPRIGCVLPQWPLSVGTATARAARRPPEPRPLTGRVSIGAGPAPGHRSGRCRAHAELKPERSVHVCAGKLAVCLLLEFRGIPVAHDRHLGRGAADFG